MKVSENYIILKDSWLWSSLGVKNHSIFEIRIDNSFLQDKLPESPYILDINILLDEKTTTTERKLLNIFDAFSQTGGILGLVMAFGKTLIRSIQK